MNFFLRSLVPLSTTSMSAKLSLRDISLSGTSDLSDTMTGSIEPTVIDSRYISKQPTNDTIQIHVHIVVGRFFQGMNSITLRL